MNRHTTVTIKKQLFRGCFLLGVALAVAYPTRLIFAQHESGGDQTLVHAGVRWVWQNPLPEGNDRFGLSFTDSSNGTAVGLHGTMIRTTDGGLHCMIQSRGTTNLFCGVLFFE